MRTLLVVATLMALQVPAAVAQAPGGCRPDSVLRLDGLGTPGADLARLVEVVGAGPATSQAIRRGGFHLQPACLGAGPVGWSERLSSPAPLARAVLVLPARIEAVWNSAYPAGGNDGLVWAGRGVATLVSAGVVWRLGAVSGALAPALAWQQNRWFSTVPTDRAGALAFQSPWYGDQLDRPQRFGAGPFGAASLGQSYLQVEAVGLAAGVSTENRWLGPGLRNALLLTNEASGFPHAYLGTTRPADIGVGWLEVLALWGRLDRSRYAGHGGHPWFSALALAYQPRWMPGLSLGLGTTVIQPLASLRDDRFLSVLGGPFGRGGLSANTAGNNRAGSLWFRWVMPEAALELYGEWGRDDTATSFEALLRDPGRTQGWVWGLQKLLRTEGGWVRIHAEAIRLHDGRPAGASTGLPVWYTHGAGVDGTHAGQLLGATAGPGSDSQFLAVDFLTAGGRRGGFVERTARNEEVFWSRVDPQPGRGSDHDVEVVVGGQQVLFVAEVEVALQLGAAYRWNRDFMGNEPNFRGAVSVSWPATAR